MQFTPGAMMDKEQFFNAVYNNWHGYGLILRDGNGRMQLLKGFDEKGTDPQILWDLLEKNKDIDRYLHVRHSTKGSTDETNVQPFSVFHSTSREVYFMHNGTLMGFGDYSGAGKSDTLQFCEKVLQPALLCWWGPEGKADYTDENFQKLVVDKQWSTGSTGLFVSNDLDPKRIGNGRSQYTHLDGKEGEGLIYVSNKLYFDKVSRGPMFQKLETERHAKALEEAKKKYEENGTEDKESLLIPFGHGTTSGNGGAQKWDENAAARDVRVVRALNNIISQWDLEDPKDLVKLHSITYQEWMMFLEEDVEEGQWATAALLEHLVKMYVKAAIRNSSLQNQIKRLEMKQEKAEKRLREINTNIKKDSSNESVAAA